MAQRALDCLSPAFDLDGQEGQVSGSIGIALFPDNAEHADGVIRCADAAMYKAKQAGKGNYKVFTPDLNAEVNLRATMRDHLETALERNEFSLVFQPRWTLDEERVVGVEALLRWQNPTLGTVAPDRFVPVLEESGGIQAVGDWVLREAVAAAARWWTASGGQVPVAVNLSERQLLRADLVASVAELLKSHDLPPGALEVEMAEDVLTKERERAKILPHLAALRERGVGVTLDRFGANGATLGFLRRGMVSMIKLEQALIPQLMTDPREAGFATALVGLAHALTIEVTAVGVETAEQRARLKILGCDGIQGFLTGRPLPESELAAVVLPN